MEVSNIMFVVLFFFVVTIVLLISAIDSKHDEILGGLALLMTGFCCAAFILFLVATAKVSGATWTYSEKYSTEYIVALNDSTSIGSRKYVRGSYINEEMYYYYMVNLHNGGYVQNRVKANKTTIYYDNDNYRVEWWTRKRSWLCFYETGECNKIYIPEGSITNDFNIDLE